MQSIRKLNKTAVKRVAVWGAAVCLFVGLFSFLCSIRFRVDYYFFHSGIDSPNFVDFKENVADFNRLADIVGGVVEETPDFFETYYPHCSADDRGLVFYKRTAADYEEQAVYVVNRKDWNDIRACLRSFPDGGYGTIYLDKEYPDYIFFRAEMKTRLFVYTGGERPNRIIDALWDRYEFVRVDRLSKGWYDIRPMG